jgi:hypothetical protein
MGSEVQSSKVWDSGQIRTVSFGCPPNRDAEQAYQIRHPEHTESNGFRPAACVVIVRKTPNGISSFRA